MDIEIVNFKGIKRAKHTLKEGLTLFTGGSGEGKSTILNSIKWCLYGGGVITPFGDTSKEKGHSYVKCNFHKENLSVRRSKPPELLQIEYEDDEYKGDEAQNIIYNIFGSKELWLSTSYLQQDIRHPLISSSNSEKESIIREIVLGDEEMNYLSVIGDAISETTLKFTDISSKYSVRKEDLQEKYEIYKIGKLKDRDFSLIEKEDSIRSAHNKLKDKLTIYNKNLIYKKEREESLVKLEEIENSLKEYPIKEISLYRKFCKWRSILVELSNYDIIIPSMSRDEVYKYDVEKLREEIYKYKHQNQKYEEYTSLCKSIGIKYTKEDIDNEILKYEKYIEYLNKEVRFEELLQEQYKLKDANKLLYESIGISEDRNLFIECLRCPKCNEKLKLEDNSLTVLDGELVSEEHIKIVKKIEKNKTKILKLRDEMETIDLGNYVKSELSVNNYKILKKVEILQKVDVEDLQNKLEDVLLLTKYYNLKTKEESYEEYNFIQYSEYTTLDCEDYEDKLHNLLQNRLIHRRNIDRKFEIIELDVEETQSKLSKLEEYITKIEKLKRERERLDEYLSLEKKVKKLEDSLKEITEKLETQKQLQKLIKDSFNNYLDQSLELLNYNISSMLSELFDKPFFKISLFKKLKDGRIKPSFNIEFSIKGNSYDNLNDLSGGEKDRLSLVLLIAFSNLKDSKFVLLDEVFSSLNEELREICYDLMKRYLSNKVVINVFHDAVEGYYNDTIMF